MIYSNHCVTDRIFILERIKLAVFRKRIDGNVLIHDNLQKITAVMLIIGYVCNSKRSDVSYTTLSLSINLHCGDDIPDTELTPELHL